MNAPNGIHNLLETNFQVSIIINQYDDTHNHILRSKDGEGGLMELASNISLAFESKYQPYYDDTNKCWSELGSWYEIVESFTEKEILKYLNPAPKKSLNLFTS